MRHKGYNGQFEECGSSKALSERVDNTLVAGHLNALIKDALRIVAARNMTELHQIALQMEAVIVLESIKIAVANRRSKKASCMEDWAPGVFKTPVKSVEARAAEIRSEAGDLNIWLRAGAETAPTEQFDFFDFPKAVRRAEYFSTAALWKALSLRQFSASAFQALRLPRDGPTQLQEFFNQIGAPVGQPAKPLPRDPMLAALNSFMAVAELGAEVARAATLATEAEYLETALADVRLKASVEAENALQALSVHRLKEAGLKGAKARALRFEPARRRAIELYKESALRSRAASAEVIWTQIEQEGFRVAHSSVLKWLSDHDAEIKERQQKKKRIPNLAGLSAEVFTPVSLS